MINNVVLVGRMTRDAELRYTPSNVAVATFSLAVNRNFKGANGERETDFINCVIWRQQAENLANWAKKGALIGITGRIQTRNYENQQGQRVYVTEVVCENFQLLESRSASEQRGTGGGSFNNNENGYQSQNRSFGNNNAGSGFNNNNNSFNPSSSQSQNNNGMPDFDKDSDPFGGSGSSIDISDDDLPF